MISLIPNETKRHPDTKFSHFSLQNLFTTLPISRANIIQAICAAPPPQMILKIPYFAANAIAAT